MKLIAKFENCIHANDAAMYRVLLISVLLFVCLPAFSQHKSVEFAWEADFEMYFDNREYNMNSPYISKTIFGASIAPRIGVNIKDNHSLMAGVEVLKQFGGGFSDWQTGISFYYSYTESEHKVFAGVFPRDKMSDNYSRAFFSDSLAFFTPVLQGVLYQYSGACGKWDAEIEAGVDWMGQYSKDKRERFMIFSSGEFTSQNRIFTLGYNAYMYHFASSQTAVGVVDNFLLYPFFRADFAPLVSMDCLSLKLGWYQAFQNDRIAKRGFLTPGGAEIDIKLSKWRVYLQNTLYAGGNLMPLYYSTDETNTIYGDSLYYGDRYYSVASGLYDRLELGWEPRITEFLSVRIALTAHFMDKYCGWQQVLCLKMNF